LPNFPIYVVDDDPLIRQLIVDLCSEEDLSCSGFASGEEFLAALDALDPGCVLLDMRLPRRNGAQVQAEMAHRERDFAVIAITGFADVDMAVESMKMGAVDFLEKPFKSEVLFEAIRRAFAKLRQA